MTAHDRFAPFDDGLFLRHFAILCAGFLAGMAAAYLFMGIGFDFSGELEQARLLGIVSPTIMSGYAKKRDILNYLAVTGFPTLFAVGAWLVWARDGKKRAALAAMFAPEPLPSERGWGWRLALVLTACGLLFFSFNVNLFHYPSYNESVGAWPFLGEEVENLAWVHSLLNGGVYGRDIHCLYGPMLIYPLVWFMRLFGTTVVMERIYTYGLDLIAYAVVIGFLYKTLRSKTLFVLGALCYFFVYTQGPGHILSPNMTYLRVALGFVPILLAYRYQERRSTWTLVGAGLVLGQSLLFSQEVGVCSTLAVLCTLLLMRRGERHFAEFFSDASRLLVGIILSVLPLLAYFAGKGALGPFVDNLFVHPRLLGLGFTALAFPDLREFFAAPWGALFHYWPVFLYIAATLYLFPMVILGLRDRDTLLRVALLAFGAILFRAALARSDQYHVFFVAQPAFLLLFLFADGSLARLRELSRLMLYGRAAALVSLTLWLLLVSVNTPYAAIWASSRMHLLSIPTKFNQLSYGVSLPDLPRAGIQFDPQTAGSIQKIGSFLNDHTRPSDYVYFFPNEAAYNFLFDRRNPTRYVVSYFAVTRQQRLELIADLERKRPEYVVYSRRTWRIDDIPETVQVPEVCDYLNANYLPAEDLGEILILRRKSP